MAEIPAPMLHLTFRRNGVKHEHPEMEERPETDCARSPSESRGSGRACCLIDLARACTTITQAGSRLVECVTWELAEKRLIIAAEMAEVEKSVPERHLFDQNFIRRRLLKDLADLVQANSAQPGRGGHVGNVLKRIVQGSKADTEMLADFG